MELRGSTSSPATEVDGVRRPQQARAHRTLERIRQAALELLRTRRFDEVAMAEIAERAGVSVGTLYHYYPSKEVLLVDVHATVVDSMSADLTQHLSLRITSLDALRGFLDGSIRMAWDQLLARRNLEREILRIGLNDRQLEDHLRGQERRVRQIFEALIAMHKDQLQSRDPARAAEVIYTLIEGTLLRAVRFDDVAGAGKELIPETVDMIIRYLLPGFRNANSARKK
ncbi:MAG: HTH-type transcriptional regulator BetI [Myxococcota bacterium]|nr:HTH-type transcriptional regulator BetI [Myxococcota bacterium]